MGSGVVRIARHLTSGTSPARAGELRPDQDHARRAAHLARTRRGATPAPPVPYEDGLLPRPQSRASPPRPSPAATAPSAPSRPRRDPRPRSPHARRAGPPRDVLSGLSSASSGLSRTLDESRIP